MYQELLTFWFEETSPESWWAVNPEFDAHLWERFSHLLEQAARGELFAWREEARGRLAEILVLDQLSRNIYRNTPAAYAQDAMALALAQEAVRAGVHKAISPVECAFLLLPYMHSESRKIHVVAESLYREFAPADNLDFELRHKAIIDRFGRYPHRNRILGRESTPEEIEFLKQPGSSF